MRQTMIVSILIVGFWMTLSERITFESVAFGLAVNFIIYLLCKEFKIPADDKKVLNISSVSKYLVYLCLLIREIITSNIQVAKIVLSPRITISPTIFTYETKLKSQFHRAVLANSITLTPGTLTMELQNNVLTIHCLREEYAEGVINSKLEKILLEIEE
ncbi:multicomponent Na+:H+ antiporter subunit E [Anaerosolibacter carboniphilus]|uniref:Multicomponent Na+:H+ antiporter subunit E n=1 Tax=Anaerosolibacter carboniphilus TaxID=1417629 RepID=A0A841KPA7_9FIRM|nr:Na+/H+ antiporter subunit E [Anaerosolibacter carboniphilus]MBB6213940.1 multicomponent Na+:H+ antiporter subunit E [Anaerosolibacter carboniphilus]